MTIVIFAEMSLFANRKLQRLLKNPLGLCILRRIQLTEGICLKVFGLGGSEIFGLMTRIFWGFSLFVLCFSMPMNS